MKPATGRIFIALAGMALVIGFFLPWLDVGNGYFQASGWEVFQGSESWTVFRVVTLLVPIAGLAMVLMAVSSARSTRLVSFGAGFLFAGYAVYKAVQAFLAMSGWGLWLVLAAALAALAVPLLTLPEKK